MKHIYLLPLLTMLATSQAAAQTSCGPRDVVISALTAQFGETRQSIGIGSGNVVIEVFASENTGSWTITATNTGGVTCLIAAGLSYEALQESLPATGSDT